MDKLTTYQNTLVDLLDEYVQFLAGSNAYVKPQAFIDREHNHFQLLKVGWDNTKGHFVFGILFHFSILDNKIWLQLNNTEFQVVDELIEKGVPKSDIVLGFQPTALRQKQGLELVV